MADEQRTVNYLASDVLHADALDLLRSLDAGSVQVIITDPPYGIAYNSNYYVDKNPHAPIARDWNFQVGAFFGEAARALGEGGALYLFTRWDVYPLWAGQSPRELSLKNLIVWGKDNWSSGDLTGNFGNQYELIMFFTKGRHRLRGHRFPNIWNFPRISAKRLRMPAEKPVALYHRAISASSDHGDLIVDPFCGSGTAAEAAKIAGRRFVLGDLEPSMVAMARDAWGCQSLNRNSRPQFLGARCSGWCRPTYRFGASIQRMCAPRLPPKTRNSLQPPIVSHRCR